MNKMPKKAESKSVDAVDKLSKTSLIRYVLDLASKSLAIKLLVIVGFLVFVLVIFFGAQIIADLIVSLYPHSKGWTTAESNDWLTNSVGAQFAFVSMTEAFTIYAIYLSLKFYGTTLRAIGLLKPRWRDIGIGIIAAPAYFIIYLISVSAVSYFIPSLNINQHQEVGFNNVHGSLQLALTFISLVILPPLAEEIMVRGFIYTGLKKLMPTFVAVLTTSLLFAVAHLPEGGAAGPLYIAALDTFILSLILIYLRERTGSLWASITLHSIKNGVAFLALFVFAVH